MQNEPPVRKISMTCLLSPENEFEGGDLEFPQHDLVLPCVNNSMIVFPGWVTHSVPPEKSDKERVIVAGNLSIDRPQATSV